ncbi:MAG TPA: class I tRNA ligase family protein, partial [Bacillota bacterium]|nr:class I tRNA ligase family protein [Bacillota bacterium]
FGKKPWVKYWLHNEWLLVDGEKMSKSKGNFYKLKELEEKGYSPLELRYLFLSAHYRKQLNFTFANLDYAKNSLQRLKEIISKLDKKQKKNKKNVELAYKQFLEFLNEDLNTPRALSYMWDILREDRLNDTEKYELVLRFDKVFSLDLDKEEKIKIPDQVKKLVREREMLRKKKEWERADEIRKKINKSGFAIEDTEKGVIIKKRK